MNKKFCSGCNQDLDKSEFNISKYTGVLKSLCKKCELESQKIFKEFVNINDFRNLQDFEDVNIEKHHATIKYEKRIEKFFQHIIKISNKISDTDGWFYKPYSWWTERLDYTCNESVRNLFEKLFELNKIERKIKKIHKNGRKYYYHRIKDNTYDKTQNIEFKIDIGIRNRDNDEYVYEVNIISNSYRKIKNIEANRLTDKFKTKEEAYDFLTKFNYKMYHIYYKRYSKLKYEIKEIPEKYNWE